MLFNKLFGRICPDMGVDLGTTSTLVCVKGRGIVLDEPSVVAVRKGTNHILLNGRAVGTAAREAMARNPENAVALWPLKDGVINDFDIGGDMLAYFIRKAQSRKWAARPRIVVAVPCDMSAVEKRAITVAAERAGCGKVYLIEKPVAAAIGMGIEIGENDACMIVDIGGGTTQIAIITQQGIAHAQALRTAGDRMNEAVRLYARERYNLLMSKGSAEKIKIEIGSARETGDELSMEIKGVDATAGLPRRVVINSTEVRRALETAVGEIVGAVKAALEGAAEEMRASIAEDGIFLCGGGALLRGMDRMIMDATNAPVRLAENPTTIVALGTARILDEIDTLSGALEDTQSIN